LGISFLVNFFNEVRVSMCSREVFRGLLNLSPEQGAYVALLAAFIKVDLLHNQVPGSSATLSDVAEHPFAYKSELCYTAFRLLENQREIGRAKFRECKANKIVLPPQALELREVSDLAFGLWMMTIGVGCKPSSLEQVDSCWSLVASCSPSIDEIQAIVSNLHYELGQLMDQPMETGTWIALAHKIPAFLVK
jgi:hypothetical protein